METINITLPTEVKNFIDKSINSGFYANAGEFVSDLVRNNINNQTFIDELKIRFLKEKLSDGVKQVESENYAPISYKNFINELNSK
jgi:Arc/MetJ-type ribon-helix-helix transcriptional regulator